MDFLRVILTLQSVLWRKNNVYLRLLGLLQIGWLLIILIVASNFVEVSSHTILKNDIVSLSPIFMIWVQTDFAWKIII